MRRGPGSSRTGERYLDHTLISWLHPSCTVGVDTRFRSMFVAAIVVVALTNACARHAHAPARTAASTVAFPIGEVPLTNYGAQAPGRMPCAAVMLLPEEQAGIGSDLIATIEGHLLSRGLRITSSAWTG